MYSLKNFNSMKKNYYIMFLWFVALLIFQSTNVYSQQQGVAISEDGSIAHPAAILELKSQTMGFLPPRMTTEQRNAIVMPPAGLIIFNTSIPCLQVFDGTNWACSDGTNVEVPPCNAPNTPTFAVHTPSETQIIWNWNSVAGADGYKYNTVNNYATATDIFTNTTFTQIGLDCETEYILYVWAYNACAESNVLQLDEETNTCSAEPLCGGTFTDDRDGNEYPTVLIGNQCWMAANLRYLPEVFSYDQWAANAYNFLHGYGVYDYDGDDVATAKSHPNYLTHGVLYNWYAAMDGESSSNANPSGVKGACPTGWHLPSGAEITQLFDYLKGSSDYWCGGNSEQISKSLASTTGWVTDGSSCAVGNNQSSNNASGFSLLPSGVRMDHGEDFVIGERAYLWTSYEPDFYFSAGLYMDYESSEPILHDEWFQDLGFSVRCIKD